MFLTGQFHPLQGGMEVAALREAKSLRAAGHDVRVLTLRLQTPWPTRVAVEGVPVRRLGGVFFRGKLRTRYGAKLVSELLVWLQLIRERHSYDVVHLRQLGVMARPALLAAMMTGKPLIVCIAGAGPKVPDRSGLPVQSHAGTLDARPSRLIAQDTLRYGDIGDLRRADWLGGLTLRMLRHRCVTFAAASTQIQADLIRHGFRPEQIRLLPTGVDVEAFAQTAQRVRERTSMGTEPVVICVGHLRYEKGIDILLHAWQTVHRQVPAARLVVAGGGPLGQQLQDLSVELGIDQTVAFVGMIQDVRSVLSEADAFVLPSRHEGLSNALLEAMASGLPTIATRVSGSEDVIIDGTNGRLVPPDDPDALASALVTVLTDRTRARTMGEAGRQRIVEAFSQARLTNQLERLYAELSTLPGSGGVRGEPAYRALPIAAVPGQKAQPIARNEAES